MGTENRGHRHSHYLRSGCASHQTGLFLGITLALCGRVSKARKGVFVCRRKIYYTVAAFHFDLEDTTVPKKWIEKRPEIRKFSPTEASWLAGVIDGEGSLGLYDYGYEGRRVIIQIGNTVEPFVKEVRRVIGCGSNITQTIFGPSHKGRKPMYRYSLKGSLRCYWVIKQITRFLIIKKKKALSIIKELEEKPFGRWKNATKESREKASEMLKAQWKDPKMRAK